MSLLLHKTVQPVHCNFNCSKTRGNKQAFDQYQRHRLLLSVWISCRYLSHQFYKNYWKNNCLTLSVSSIQCQTSSKHLFCRSVCLSSVRIYSSWYCGHSLHGHPSVGNSTILCSRLAWFQQSVWYQNAWDSGAEDGRIGWSRLCQQLIGRFLVYDHHMEYLGNKSAFLKLTANIIHRSGVGLRLLWSMWLSWEQLPRTMRTTLISSFKLAISCR